MTDVVDFELNAFPPRRTCPFSPPPEYAQLRAERPVALVKTPAGEKVWLITGYKEVRQILADPRVSADRTHPAMPNPLMDLRTMQRLSREARPMIMMDPPEHTTHRHMIINEFTVRRMTALRPRIQEIVDDFVGQLLAGPRPADLVQALSLPVPSLVICELLGVPYDDHDFFQRRSNTLLDRCRTPDERVAAAGELHGYLDELVVQKEEQPGDDLIGRLVVKYREAGSYDHAYMVATAQSLLNAGHTTTANMISLGVLALLQNPELRAGITAASDLTPQVVEELLRYFSIGELAMARVATADIEIGGRLIRAGEGLLALGAAANRDPDVFDNPDQLDFHRGARQHVAFGYGVHQCLGQNLARQELEIVFNTLFGRIPGLRLAVAVDELPFKDDSPVYGLHEMPVTW
ncbi:putative cytochrome P450 hydroxylase [[Actinomadura] parvosata subsp. kistnae]|uniref:cytochrome P450 n=1 Tax=[Actinomadura] parvosata TaxID=1955412 RepID=UPI000D2C028E|nr:putative cytochrome P450 hydroxylase [Actinomadura parvosata subsp. kistnae]